MWRRVDKSVQGQHMKLLVPIVRYIIVHTSLQDGANLEGGREGGERSRCLKFMHGWILC
jgi:hypothetical protein